MRKAVPTLPAVLRDPGPVVKAIRLDDERVSVPPADRISHVSQNRGIRRQFAPVGPDGPPRMTQLKELQNSVGQLDELIRAGLATAETESVVARSRTLEVERVRITKAGRMILMGR